MLPKQPLASASEVHWKDLECELISAVFLMKNWLILYQQGRRQACTAMVTLLYDMPLV